LFNLINGIGAGYWIGFNGEKKPLDAFQNKDILWEFTKSDDWRYSTFLLCRSYSPGDSAISDEQVALTFMKDADKLIPVYRFIKDKLV
jgi:hypothetical protein